ncbi:MAG: tRNA threonylcarbamoyladenosine dehydratase [Candidatus Metalachnospira sp.]|nr:tRNA threonylcarbamoyladenosine dehydratase [Candidatus Metalachnospira sp.]
MINQFSRTELLIGEEALEKLHNAKVAVFGVGGVGGFAVEALARSGIGHFVLIDNDTVSLTNLNRQIIALHSTIGKYKTEVMKQRIADINPNADVEIHDCFYLPENKDEFDFSKYSYVIDAVDTVAAKLSIIEEAKKYNIPVISSMGAGNKLNPTMFEIADISKTSVCPLAKVMRYELKKRGINKVKVVYSKEEPLKPLFDIAKEEPTSKRAAPGSISFIPSVVGLILAGEVIKDIAEIKQY